MIEIRNVATGAIQLSIDSDSLQNADLRGVDLSGGDLFRFDFLQADLRKANLSGADLCEASLREADLREVDLREADLSHADLRGALLDGAKLRDACLPCCIGNMEEIKSMQCEDYPVVWTADCMWVGYIEFDLTEWWSLPDDKIARQIDLDWWLRWKPILQQIIN